jgi:hypothetical protein
MSVMTSSVIHSVTKHTDDEGNRPSWVRLTDLWNKEHSGE